MNTMRRDWDKVRLVLLALEAADPKEGLAWGMVPGLDDDETLAYFKMLVGSGLVKGHPAGSQPMILTEITWQGYNLLDVIRRDGFWSKIKDEAKRRGIALSFDAIGQISKFIMQQLMGD